jgi:hypothetical protein
VLPGARIEKVVEKEESGRVYLGVEWTPVARISSDPEDLECVGRLEGFEYDLVVLATGYVHNGYETLLRPVHEASEDKGKGDWSVGKDYRLSVKGLWVSMNAGIWLQGCNEETHGVSLLHDHL